ncbi:extracellular solute-binding protein [Cohnella cellulosilytica]|uniref:Extracellular solute-binding protein n=1 Tax=Cohnella cellulosilytica TaxID=986710 RepID=A0ABW2FCI1_9BACL
MSRKWVKRFIVPVLATLLLAGCTNGSGSGKQEDAASTDSANKPATWIADRKIKGLVFMDSDDYTEDMNPEIVAKIKELTGIDYEIQIMKANQAIDGLIADLAANDLPDFITFYLNNSGRPEMPVVLKAAREEMFTDLTPLLKNTKIYSKYLEDDFLPLDTKYGVMFRPEFEGSSYFVHMNVNRKGGDDPMKLVGGPYIRKDIAEAIGVDPSSVTTTEQLYEVAAKIKAGNFKDNNGKSVVPIGPAYWGGHEVGRLFNDLEWGADDQRIYASKDGKVLHEAETPYALKKVEYVQKLLKEGLLQPEFFTMDESRSTEGALNGTWGIIADMHSYQEFNKDMHYVPLGPLNYVDGPYQMKVDFKAGYSAWAIPATTKNPEDIVKLADFLASREGKLLWKYGLEGRDYTLDGQGNPLVKQEVLDLKAEDPNEAKKLGFAGVGNNWGELLGSTDTDNLADFGEVNYGDSLNPDGISTPHKVAELWKFDEKRQNAIIQDAYTPLSFLGEFNQSMELKAALDNYNDSLVRAYYSKSLDQAKEILDSALKQLRASGLDDYLKLVADKNADPKTKVKY